MLILRLQPTTKPWIFSKCVLYRPCLNKWSCLHLVSHGLCKPCPVDLIKFRMTSNTKHLAQLQYVLLSKTTAWVHAVMRLVFRNLEISIFYAVQETSQHVFNKLQVEKCLWRLMMDDGSSETCLDWFNNMNFKNFVWFIKAIIILIIIFILIIIILLIIIIIMNGTMI